MSRRGKSEAVGAVLGAHVGNRSSGPRRELRQSVADELDELVDDAVLQQRLGQREHAIGAVVPTGLAREGAPDDEAMEVVGAKHGCLGFDPPDAPAEHAGAR